MSFTPLGPIEPPSAAWSSRASTRPRPSASSEEVASVSDSASFQSSPGPIPVEVWEEVQQADQRWEELQRQGRELRFRVDEGQLRVEIRDLAGELIRTVPAHGALEVAGGAEVE